VVADTLLLIEHQPEISSHQLEQVELTKPFSSGKPPSIFLSHIKWGGLPSRLSQTLKRPPVSSEFRGIIDIAFKAGGGNVRNSSVETQVARWSLQAMDEIGS